MESYDYLKVKPNLFTEDGQVMFLAIRDQVNYMLGVSGAVTMGYATKLPKGIGAASSWDLMACVDRMVELKELEEVPTKGWAQHRVFVKPYKG